MNILAIISRDLEKGSTKYRIAQYLEFLGSKGIEIEFLNRKVIDNYTLKQVSRKDLVFNQKCLFRYSLAKKLIACSRRTIFDFDDAIYTRPRQAYSKITGMRVKRRLHLWLKNSDIVTTSSNFLAQYARQYSNAVEIVPMGLNLDRWKPIEKKEKKEIRIGWAGAPVNIPLIEGLDHGLTLLSKKYSFLKIAIFSGQKPRLTCPFEYFPFKPAEEISFVQNLDIGLLPLIHDEFSEGKSPIKAIQYLACGAPVVGNVFGATREILNEKNSIAVSSEDEWISGLEALITNPNQARMMGRAGREHVKKNNNMRSSAEQLFKIILQN